MAGKLRDTASDAPPFVTLPKCGLTWAAPGSPGSGGPKGGAPPLRVPLYLTEGRERAIAEVQFPVFDAEEASKWILAGTACFLGRIETDEWTIMKRHRSARAGGAFDRIRLRNIYL